ncbi:NAD(P)H-dependent flavin oxidoreductase [Paraglaciecola sp.]|uniref:NAD(P)H-dependent flavin oxidoreductase n=1 Tax=Paraglaciecola sp. TaxID=1920173 RepID=UPI003EF9AD09
MPKPNISRRKFIQNSLLFSAASMPLAGMAGDKHKVDGLSVSSNVLPLNNMNQKLMKLLNIKYPIIQAPAAGAVTTELVAAVANKGALGGLPLTWTKPSKASKWIKAVQGKTTGEFYANFVLNFPCAALDKTLEAGVKIIQFSWGIPNDIMLNKIKQAGITLGIQVTSENSAISALKAGADYLVVQGLEAGGHVHASRPLASALKRIVPIAKDIPVVASGGIASGADIKQCFALGAAGVVMGSRFVATQESMAHPEYKKTLVESTYEDTAFTVCLNKYWGNATHRIIRNNTFEMWEGAGCPPENNRPGEGDVIARFIDNDKTIVRYQSNPPSTEVTGQVKDMAMYAGKGVDHIHDIPPAADVIERIWQEYLMS